MCTAEEQTGTEVVDIFRRYGERYRKETGLTRKQLAVMSAISRCRTPHCGSHIDRCDACGYIEQDYNSCRDRHCPKCQGISRRKWVDARLADILPVNYYHVVFTLPHLLQAILPSNRRLIYNLLFSCASETLLTFGRDPRWLGGELGFYGVLHTWGQKLWYHPHVHFIVAGGALSNDGRWVSPAYAGKFLFPVRALSKVFRGKFIEGLKAAYEHQELVIPEAAKRLKMPHRFEQWIDRLASRSWVVYCKSPLVDAQRVVRYIGRYSHRVAISNRRIIGVAKDQVCFRYKDYRDKKVISKLMTLGIGHFIERFLFHVLPERFHKIRYYGFLANGRCKARLAQIREILPTWLKHEKDRNDQNEYRLQCPRCSSGRLKPIVIIRRFAREIVSGYGILNSADALDSS